MTMQHDNAAPTGWWGLHEVLRRPVLETLRRAGAV